LTLSFDIINTTHVHYLLQRDNTISNILQSNIF